MTRLAILAGVAVALQSPGAAPSKVLVMPFSVTVAARASGGAGASLWLGEAGAIVIADRLQQLGVRVFDRDERIAAFERLQMPTSATLTRATMIRVAEVIGASDVVFGDASLTDVLSIRAHVIRLSSAQQLPEVAAQGALNDLLTLFSRVGDRLGITATPAPALVPPAPSYPSLEAFENYVKGLVAATPASQQKFLEAALKLAPKDARTLIALWAVHNELGAHERALAMAGAVPPDSPLSRRARFLAGISMLEMGRFDGASRMFSTLSAERPSAVLSNALGVTQLRRPRPASIDTNTAAFYFNRAVEQDPGNVDYLFNLGYAYAIAKDPRAALYWLREAVGRDTASGDAHLVMGAVLAASNRGVEAERELELATLLGARAPATTAAALADKMPGGLERLPTDLDLSSGPRLAATLAAPAQRGQQETASFYLERGRKLFDAQRDREAMSELQRAIYLAPYDSEPHVLLGRLLERGGRLTEAIDEFKIAIWARETAEARVALGAALLESGDASGARREAQRALALQPEYAPAKELLKKLGGNILSLHG